jgi:hypothetical protein
LARIDEVRVVAAHREVRAEAVSASVAGHLGDPLIVATGEDDGVPGVACKPDEGRTNALAATGDEKSLGCCHESPLERQTRDEL